MSLRLGTDTWRVHFIGPVPPESCRAFSAPLCLGLLVFDDTLGLCTTSSQRYSVAVMSWAPQATTDFGQWVGNGLRFATKEEAEGYVAEFSLVRSTRVVESSDPVNYAWENGRVVRRE
jgi:hypothetical protein